MLDLRQLIEEVDASRAGELDCGNVVVEAREDVLQCETLVRLEGRDPCVVVSVMQEREGRTNGGRTSRMSRSSWTT